MANVGRTNLRAVATTFLILNSIIATSKAFGGTISTDAGNGSSGFSGDGGLATSATFNPESECFRVAVDSDGNIYVADTFNYRIQKFDSTGTFLTKWGTSRSRDVDFT